MSNNKKDIPSFEQFGQNFQNKLAVIITRESAFADQIFEVLEFNYFEYKHLQTYIQKIFNYKQQYKIHPSVETIKTVIKTELENENEMLREQIDEFFSSFVLSNEKVEDAEYVKDKSLDFCKKQKLKEAMIKSIDYLEKSSFDEISTTINNALKLGNDNNFGHDYIRDFEKRFEEKSRDPISTGWQLVDNLCGGGHGRSELGVIISGTGVGKSHLLVHLG
ncbi:MAG: hypothetical protein Q8P81_02025, partial [Nanoarchaeota archaeon]|nr:hypothetical protein [Nanoarchaeota archaeon]